MSRSLTLKFPSFPPLKERGKKETGKREEAAEKQKVLGGDPRRSDTGEEKGELLTCESDIPHHPASIYEEDKQTNVPGKTSAPHADRRCEDPAGLLTGFRPGLAAGVGATVEVCTCMRVCGCGVNACARARARANVCVCL